MRGSSSPEQELAIEVQLEAAGLDIEADVLPVADMVAQVIELDYGASCWSFNVLDESAWVGIDHNLRSDSSSDHPGLDSLEMAAALLQVRAAPTSQEKQEELFEIQRVWNEVVPCVTMSRNKEWATWLPTKVTCEGVFMSDGVRVEC